MNDFSHVTTPAFLVDRSIVEQNCVRMRAKALASGVGFRPHVKTHKTIEIARMQHGGATGPITVSTMAEAEFFADGGFGDITYAVPIAPEKLARAAALAARIERLNILLDSELALRAVEEFHAANGVVFDVFLKVDCGYHRAGVDPNHPDSVRLAMAVANSPAIHLQGLLTHAGHSYNASGVEEIRRIAAEEIESLTRFRALLAMDKLTRSIGSTPTTAIAETFADTDEVRPGNYVFFDAFQSTLGSCLMDDVAVSVLSTVVGSYPERGEAIIDAGALALSKDVSPEHLDPSFGYGLVCNLDLHPLPARLIALSQEHGKLTTTIPLPVGTRVRVLPNHSCLTAAMYDRYHVIDGSEIVEEWRPVRGW
ncbi:MAG: alanine racemase [Acidobacteria bacterium]|nr:alanine racemase [Acidobacteriota bacterium]